MPKKNARAPARAPDPPVEPAPPTTIPFTAKNPNYFPFATYTASVGVHTTLHIFSALFLPRTPAIAALLDSLLDEAPLTSRDRPQNAFLDALTRSPAATLVCACLGAAVLQAWWGGWIRSWRIEVALGAVGDERKVERARADARKASNLVNAWLATGAASSFFHVVLVLFGAPLTSYMLQTYFLALLLSLLTVFTPAYALGSPLLVSGITTRLAWTRLFAEFSAKTPIERALLYPAVGALFGAWLGVIPIALDWDRPWQAWPLTPAAGAIGGYIFASIAALTNSALRVLAEEGRRAS